MAPREEVKYRLAVPRPMIRRTMSVAVVVSDGPGAAGWYRDKLGFDVAEESEGHWVVVHPAGQGHGVHLHLCAGFYDLEPGNTGIAFATDDLPATHQELEGRGVEFTEPPTREDWGYYAAFRDPDGNEFWLLEE